MPSSSLAEQMLADGRPYLTGAAPTLADCALDNPVWFLLGAAGRGKAVPPLDRLPRLVAWSETHEGASATARPPR